MNHEVIRWAVGTLSSGQKPTPREIAALCAKTGAQPTDVMTTLRHVQAMGLDAAKETYKAIVAPERGSHDDGENSSSTKQEAAGGGSGEDDKSESSGGKGDKESEKEPPPPPDDDPFEKVPASEVTDEVLRRMLRDARASYRDELFINLFVTGPAGCGKTWRAQEMARLLKLPFHALSMSEGADETHLIGGLVPDVMTGEMKFTPSSLVRAFSKPGVFLLDEIDAASANALLAVNTAASNGYIHLPGDTGEVVHRSKMFILVGAANTFGQGASRQYLRNQLDEATLNRFARRKYEVTYSHQFELAYAKKRGVKYALGIIHAAREVGEKFRIVVSTRDLMVACADERSGMGIKELVEYQVAGWPEEAKKQLAAKLGGQ